MFKNNIRLAGKLMLSAVALLLGSCYYNDGPEFEEEGEPKTRAELFYWYFNEAFPSDADSLQVVGVLVNEEDAGDFYSINRNCLLSHDTIYIIQRTLSPRHNMLNARIMTKDSIFEVHEKLN